MRAGMEGKPLDFDREYFEVRCTTAEKLYLELGALQSGVSLNEHVKSELSKKVKLPIFKSELKKIKHLELELRKEKQAQIAALKKSHNKI
jgi:hypothetical protein